jgi:hypothetical protein
LDHVSGELWIGGIGVAAGYYGDPTRTAEVFHGGTPADRADGMSRWYRSGDICQWDGTGELEFIGRRDRQVKIRGNSMELTEVEAALLSIPGVHQASAVMRDDLGPVPLLVAYVVGTGAPPPAQVRERVSAMLPGYMVPTVIEPLVALPLTPNGKVDTSRLPAPTFSPKVQSAGPSVDGLVETVQEVMSWAIGGPRHHPALSLCRLPGRAARTYRHGAVARSSLARTGAGAGTDGRYRPLILRNDRLMKLMEPMLRADFEVFDNYKYRPGEPLGIPISVFGTRGDPRLNLERLGSWYQLTDQSTTLRILVGNHFFVGDAAKVLVDTLSDDLRARLRDGSEQLG